MENTSRDTLFVPTFIARQPIFDSSQSIWGYELLYRHSSDATAAIFSDEESATLAVAACASCQRMSFAQNSKLLINFSERSILEKVPHALAAEDTVVEIAETPPTTPGYLECLQQLKREGYRIALDGYEAREGCEQLFNMADIVKIDVLEKDPETVSGLVEKTRDKQVLLVAKRIEEHEHFHAAKKLDFSLFQGFFFRKPEIIEGRTLTSNEMSRLNLFALMENDEPDFDKLTSTIQADVAISYNLLSYLNSPAMGMREKIKSIKQALLLLGWKQIKNWLRVVILRDLNPKEKPSELPYLSVQRGKFFQLASSGLSNGPSPDNLFLLGLFSMLDSMLSMPMETVVANLPMETAFTDALCGKDNDYRPWLILAKSFESADWETLDRIIPQLGLDPVNTAQSYYESIAWASLFFQQSHSG